MTVSIGDIDKLKAAHESFKAMLDAKQEFIDEYNDDDGNEPDCGYEVWDEEIADYNHELAYLGELLFDAVGKALGLKEDS
ncbi:hypothetical protein KIY83_gp78 [Mycobacterium phage Fameo]|uniref:Uncharacterized protein n=2 Tax=Turbidovirus TaxID=2948936 RepID=A0A220NSG6_9CAUD|nr:hypothetical protein KIY83_gp78 [Mycobacterium phage Fameo]YP_010063980.1 hypothetical protein KIY85_gp77 [Mycobacterium phage Heffalump]ASJ79764.1 hypothetical protein SEA_HEFFALUMP_77 [Mycobacterium phage Heffalump]AVR76847.1 hypothetical protein SEA_FAMEO_78 [Mycobacterium phage Fameo]QGJ89026.1 hypothetical protein SEA_QUEENB2_77 [Mycobacterium phage QueenB2]